MLETQIFLVLLNNLVTQARSSLVAVKAKLWQFCYKNCTEVGISEKNLKTE